MSSYQYQYRDPVEVFRDTSRLCRRCTVVKATVKAGVIVDGMCAVCRSERKRKIEAEARRIVREDERRSREMQLREAQYRLMADALQRSREVNERMRTEVMPSIIENLRHLSASPQKSYANLWLPSVPTTSVESVSSLGANYRTY